LPTDWFAVITRIFGEISTRTSSMPRTLPTTAWPISWIALTLSVSATEMLVAKHLLIRNELKLLENSLIAGTFSYTLSRQARLLDIIDKLQASIVSWKLPRFEARH
jgi:hypothetical protein